MAGDRRERPQDRRARLAAAILALKVCDPALGSGHFLVDLVNWLATEAFTAIGGAESKATALELDWRSPSAARLEVLAIHTRAPAGIGIIASAPSRSR